MTSEKRNLGDICEQFAVEYFLSQGFEVLERNYRKKWGEIDIIAKNCDNLHFIEVKGMVLGAGMSPVEFSPEENIHTWKRKRLWKAIQTWFLEHPQYEDADWQVDVAAVFLDPEAKKAKIRWTKNIILE